MRNSARTPLAAIREIIRTSPAAALVAGAILGPPPGLGVHVSGGDGETDEPQTA
jgi:hypothetical protein